jgi:tetratricopeptide (TPR) repeat protein
MAMNRRERRKQQKKKQRQERLRQEKHLRQSLPDWTDEGDFAPEDLDYPEELLESAPALPSRFHMERTLQDLHRAIAERGLESKEALDRFLAEYSLGPGVSGPADPKAQAQELAYQAMEHPEPAAAVRLAREALRLDPTCVDALATLADVTARSTDELIDRLEEAVAVGERALGTEFFEANRGHFWGIIETRPYMRTRSHLAELLRRSGRLTEAIGHYAALLELNPNDNQGNRDPLLACYLEADDLEGARRLLEEYENAGLAVFAWGRVLERFLSGDLPDAATALKAARKKNRHVEVFLTGARQVPEEMEPYYQPGRESEAVLAADYLLAAWQRYPEAVEWLKTR